jgi:surface antigen
MIKIFVNLFSLFSNALGIRQTGDSVGKAGSAASGNAVRAPSYDGQFEPWVQAISSEANAQAKSLSARINDFSSRLERKAKQFQAVDNETSRSINFARLMVNEWFLKHSVLARFGGIFGIWFLSIEQWKRLLGLVSISDPNYLKYFLILAPAAITQWYGKTFGSKGDSTTGTPAKKKPYWQIPVPKDGGTNNIPAAVQGCTRYVATKRNITFTMKHAKYWADLAQKDYVVNETPRANSIMVFNPDELLKGKKPTTELIRFPGVAQGSGGGSNFAANAQMGHVALVEKVEYKGGQYIVHVSQRGMMDSKLNNQVLVLTPKEMRGVHFIHEKK